MSFARAGVTSATTLTKSEFLDFQFNLALGDTLSVPDGKFKLIQGGKAWFESDIADFNNAAITVTPTTQGTGTTPTNWLKITEGLTIIGGSNASFTGQVLVTGNDVSLSNITFQIDPAETGSNRSLANGQNLGQGFIQANGDNFVFSNNIVTAENDSDELGVEGIATLQILGGGIHAVTGNQFNATQSRPQDADTIWIGNGAANVSFNNIEANDNGGILFWKLTEDPFFAKNSVIEGNIITEATLKQGGNEAGIRLYTHDFSSLNTVDLGITIVDNSTNGNPFSFIG